MKGVHIVKSKKSTKSLHPNVHIMDSGKNKICSVQCTNCTVVCVANFDVSTFRASTEISPGSMISGYYTAPARFPITWIKITHQILSNNI